MQADSPSKTQLLVPQTQLQSMAQRARAPLSAPSVASESSPGDAAFPSLQPAPLGCSGAGSRSLPVAFLRSVPVSRPEYATTSTTRPLSPRSTAVVSAATTDGVAGSGQAAFSSALSSTLEIVAPTMVPSARLASRPSTESYQLWSMPCLAEQAFASPDAAQRALNNFSREHGYAVVHQSTSYDKQRNKRLVLYACDRHGERRKHNALSKSARRPNASSRKCGCPMRVSAVRKVLDATSTVWMVEHRGRAVMHNHPPSSDPASHPILRRANRNETVRLAIAVDGETGTRASQTMARLLLEDLSLAITARDVYNERSHANVAGLGGLSRVEYLLQKLQQGPFEVAFKHDAHQHLTHLFFAHEDAVGIYKQNFDVILMDCTYRTNRFNIPLLNIVGVTGMNTTIHIAQVFIEGETAPDYEWALRKLANLMTANSIPPPQFVLVDRDLALLNALEVVYPRVPLLLCLWHIFKDVQAHARRRTFPREDDTETSQPRDSEQHQLYSEAFLRVVYASSEEEFTFRRQELYFLSPVEAAYVDDVWLDIWKRRIVRCWTDNVLHFGMHATSRVEGYHAALKTWLGSSTGDFLTIHNRMEHWWRQSINKHRTQISDAEVLLPTRLRRPRFAEVIKVVHKYALLRCLDILHRYNGLLHPCTGSHVRTLGFPCVHQLHEIESRGEMLQASDFHPHWLILRDRAPPTAPARILEPNTIRDRRAERAIERRRQQHSAGNGCTGTRRIPSRFEV